MPFSLLIRELMIPQVDRVQDVFQFGIVVFYCLQVNSMKKKVPGIIIIIIIIITVILIIIIMDCQGILPWQKADLADPYFSEFCSWRSKRNGKVTISNYLE